MIHMKQINAQNLQSKISKNTVFCSLRTSCFFFLPLLLNPWDEGTMCFFVEHCCASLTANNMNNQSWAEQLSTEPTNRCVLVRKEAPQLHIVSKWTHSLTQRSSLTWGTVVGSRRWTEPSSAGYCGIGCQNHRPSGCGSVEQDSFKCKWSHSQTLQRSVMSRDLRSLCRCSPALPEFCWFLTFVSVSSHQLCGCNEDPDVILNEFLVLMGSNVGWHLFCDPLWL